MVHNKHMPNIFKEPLNLDSQQGKTNPYDEEKEEVDLVIKHTLKEFGFEEYMDLRDY